jgi:hypothetical protein
VPSQESKRLVRPSLESSKFSKTPVTRQENERSADCKDPRDINCNQKLSIPFLRIFIVNNK